MNQRDKYFYLTAVAAVLIIAVGGYVFLGLITQDYTYRVVKDGVEFVSNDAEPAALLEGLKSYSSIIVSPQLVAQGPENTYMTESITMFNTVLTAVGKRPVLVVRVLDDSGNITGCQSNLGDVTVNRELSPAECTQLLSDATSGRIFISLPDAELDAPRVVLENGVMRVMPSSYESVSGVSFTALSSMYPESGDIIEGVNSLVPRAG